MRIAWFIFSCTQLLLLTACSSAKLDTTSILSSQKAVAATSGATPPATYMITPMKVLQAEHYTEGVVFDSKNNLYFSQTKAGTVTVVTREGSRRLWAKVPGANGHKILPDGTHIIAAQNSVVQLDANGKLLKEVKDFNGKPFVYPNDITIDPQGGFYFTDSGDSNQENPTGVVYYVSATGKTNQVITGLAFANGILLTPDRKYLFVDESNKNQVDVYEVRSRGTVGPQKVFASLPVKQGDQIANKPDGMCMDAMNNLYVAHYGMGQIEVLNQAGQLIRQYQTGNLTTSNCAFGGQNLDRLFVTGGIQTEDGPGGIFRLDLGVPGMQY